jgi:plasmid maintenance system antidote protein VapI
MIDRIHGQGFLLQAHIKSQFGGAQVNFIPHSGGMTEQQISQVIRGRRKLTPSQAQSWAESLELSTEILKPFTNSAI